MKKSLKYFLISLLIFLCFVDQIFSHNILPSLLEGKEINLGPLLLSFPTETPVVGIAYLKKALVSVLFTFIILFGYFLVNVFYTVSLAGFRIGLTIFIAGFLSETISMLRGIVHADWLHIYNYSLSLIHVYIILGGLIALFFSIYHSNIIFKRNKYRKKLIIEKDQFNFCFNILSSFLIFTVAMGVFFFLSMKMLFLYLIENIPDQIKQDVPITMLLLYIMTAGCFFIFLAIFTVYVSNKIYGPVFAIKKYLKEIFVKDEPIRPFKLREGDHFTDFLDIIEKMNNKLKKQGK